ncbi:MAG: DNA polymerase III subunit beta [bacterium]|nr:MAG: DNA polymerase III subunit beta [bacterium]
MEFRIGQSEFEKCLQRAQGFINLKGANPVLSHIRIKTTGEGIDVFATDYDIGLKGFYVSSVSEQGVVTMHGRTIYDIVRQLPDEEIKLHHSGAGRCGVACENSVFKLSTIDPDEFPEEPEYPADQLMNIDTAMFKDMLKKTSYAISQNESRKTLNGVFCEIEPKSIKVVATDGHRLAFVKRNVEFPVKETISVIISRKAVNEIMKLMDEYEGALQFVRADNRIFFKMDTLLFFAREVEGSFPNYEQVIPKSHTRSAIVDVEKVVRALKRVATVASEKSHLVNFHFKKDKLEISSEVTEIGEAHEDIDIEFTQEPLKVGLNAVYTLDALNHIQSEKAILDMGEALDAVVVRPTDDDDFLSIIMPMRI